MSNILEFSFESRLVPTDAAATLQLARQVWRNNTARGLSGEMRLFGCRVHQVVEGEIETVLPLVARVLSDPRHCEIRVAALGLIGARRHQDWQVHGLPPLPAAAVPAADPMIRPVFEALSESTVAPLRRRA